MIYRGHLAISLSTINPKYDIVLINIKQRSHINLIYSYAVISILVIPSIVLQTY